MRVHSSLSKRDVDWRGPGTYETAGYTWPLIRRGGPQGFSSISSGGDSIKRKAILEITYSV